MIIADPRAFAVRAHGEQTYGGQPYVTHLDAVAALIEGADHPLLARQLPELRAVAYLHDVLEDTDITFDTLALGFGPTVAEAVELVTDPHGESRRVRKAQLHARLAALTLHAPAPVLALHVKVADRLANVRACVRDGDARLGMYRTEHDEFRPAAYRPGLCDALWHDLDGLLAPHS